MEEEGGRRGQLRKVGEEGMRGRHESRLGEESKKTAEEVGGRGGQGRRA